MSIDDLLSQLHDIQMPPFPAGTHGIELSWAPLAVFASIVVLACFLSAWRNQRWRREARSRLREIGRLTEPLVRWHALVRLAMDVTRQSGKPEMLPDCVHIPGKRATSADFVRIEDFVHRATRQRARR